MKKTKALGRMPDILVKIKDVEIQKAGEEGYDPKTFLRSKGLVDEKQLERAIKYPKWQNNYSIGYAKYQIMLTDQLNKGIKSGDTQLMKETARWKLGLKPSEEVEQVRVTIIGAGKTTKRGKK